MKKIKWQTPIKQQPRDKEQSTWTRTHKRRQQESIENLAASDKNYEKKHYHRYPINHQYRNSQLNLYLAQQKLEQSMQDSQYSEASKHIHKINYIKKKQRRQRIRTLSVEHSREKVFVKLAHQQEMQGFRKAWNEVFEKYRFYQREKRQELAMANARDVQYCRSQIRRRCRSAKPTVKLMQLRQLQTYENALRKRGKTTQLRKIRTQKKKIKVQCQKDLQRTYTKIIEQEQQKYQQRETKRYHSFMERIKQTKNDNQRLYHRQEQRLKQKFKNIIKNLQHEQSMEMKYLLKVQ